MWLRSPDTGNDYIAWIVMPSGDIDYYFNHIVNINSYGRVSSPYTVTNSVRNAYYVRSGGGVGDGSIGNSYGRRSPDTDWDVYACLVYPSGDGFNLDYDDGVYGSYGRKKIAGLRY